MATLGYARTSTRDQEAGLRAQIRDLIAAGCAERDIYTEQASSVRERPELDQLRRPILRPGDELVVTRLDRLARSARDTLALAEELGQRGVTLKILDPAMTIEPPGHANGSMAGAMSRMILTVMAAMAQLEREIMLERQREGIARAKAEGKYKGQPPHARAKAPQVIELAAAGCTGPRSPSPSKSASARSTASSPRTAPTPIERRATAGWTRPPHPCCRPPEAPETN